MDRVAESELPTTGDVLAGKYRIDAVIGRGGMGVVYAAQHVVLGQRVAVKVLAEVGAEGSKAHERFFHEARAAARIESDHVARVIDVGKTEKGAPFMVMELLEGSDLATVAAVGRLPPAQAVDYVLQALEGIAHAHAAGIVHRDLKPANLFLARRPDGTSRIKILDFGISKATSTQSAPSSMTTTSALLGSPFYMSPEQIRSARRVDARADIWAVGIILHELLSGSVPFAGETVGELFAAILEQRPAPLRTLRPDLPAPLEQVVLKCLAQKADDRFPNVAELAVALAPFASPTSAISVATIRAALGDGAHHAPSIVPSSAPAAVAMGAQTDSSWTEASRNGANELRARVSYAVAGALVAVAGVVVVAFVTSGGSDAPSRGRPAAASIEAAVKPASAPSPAPSAVAPVPPVAASSPPAVSAAPSVTKPVAPSSPSPAPRTKTPAPYNPLRDRRR